MPDIGDLTYFEVVRTVSPVPNGVLSADVVFEAQVTKGLALQADLASDVIEILTRPVKARIVDGVLIKDGTPGVELLSAAEVAIDGGFSYLATFTNARIDGVLIKDALKNLTFEAPADGTQFDLKDAAPVVSSTATPTSRGRDGYPIDDVQLAGDGQSSEYFVQGDSVGTTPPPVHIIEFTDGAWPARNPGSPMAIFQGGESPSDKPNDVNMRNVDVWAPTTGDNAPSAADLGLAGLYASFDQGRRVLVEYATGVIGAATPGFGGNLLGAFVTLVAPGGGGGSGRRGAAGTVRQGGGAASSGVELYRVWLPASWFSSTYSVILPAGGAAGLAVTADNTDGNPGADASPAQLLSGSNILQALGGLGGTGGSNGAGGVGGSALTGSLARPGVAAGGSASSTGGVGGDGGTPYGHGSAGGGAGGGITAGDVASNGGNGGGSYPVGRAAGRAGVVDTTAPAAGFFVGVLPTTLGPGGGAASKTGAAQAGGGFTNAAWGAGGAGGGASVNGNNSGAGSTGAPAWAFMEFLLG